MTTSVVPSINSVIYATIEDLVQTAQQGWVEITQRACTENVLDVEALKTAVSGGNMNAFDTDMQELASKGVYRLNHALDMASRHVETYLFPKYRAYLPLSDAIIRTSDLPAVTAAIALKRLYGTGLTDEMRKALAWTDGYLVDLAKGNVSLGALDTAIAVPQGNVITRSKNKNVDWSQY